jgi:hypothetical protein
VSRCFRLLHVSRLWRAVSACTCCNGSGSMHPIYGPNRVKFFYFCMCFIGSGSLDQLRNALHAGAVGNGTTTQELQALAVRALDALPVSV